MTGSDSFAAPVLAWYERNARDLPWRRPGTSSWAVLVSEFMLQQTPVDRVLPAYEAWVERWPAPSALAAEPAGEALRMWGRLGYPRRALRLHACAVQLCERFDGAVPDTVDDLLTLPGVGAYTARAVAAFAFGRRAPVVDTNVRRVVARAVHGRPEASAPSLRRDLAQIDELLPADEAVAARLSVAIMELGALVCVARQPRCDACPLAAQCLWRQVDASTEAAPPGHDGRLERPRPAQPRYAGSDRQVRGLLMAVLRESPVPVDRARLDLVWPDVVQRERALDGLIADGLVQITGDRRYALPGLG